MAEEPKPSTTTKLLGCLKAVAGITATPFAVASWPMLAAGGAQAFGVGAIINIAGRLTGSQGLKQIGAGIMAAGAAVMAGPITTAAYGAEGLYEAVKGKKADFLTTGWLKTAYNLGAHDKTTKGWEEEKKKVTSPMQQAHEQQPLKPARSQQQTVDSPAPTPKSGVANTFRRILGR